MGTLRQLFDVVMPHFKRFSEGDFARFEEGWRGVLRRAKREFMREAPQDVAHGGQSIGTKT